MNKRDEYKLFLRLRTRSWQQVLVSSSSEIVDERVINPYLVSPSPNGQASLARPGGGLARETTNPLTQQELGQVDELLWPYCLTRLAKSPLTSRLTCSTEHYTSFLC